MAESDGPLSWMSGINESSISNGLDWIRADDHQNEETIAINLTSWLFSSSAAALTGHNQYQQAAASKSSGGGGGGSMMDVVGAAGPGMEEPLNRVLKLVLLSIIATIASVGNIFVISAVLMEDHLKKRGNVFVVNIALADLIITGFSIPAATVGLLANLTDWRTICQIQWSSLILVSFLTAPSLAAAAADSRLQIGVGPDRYLGLVTVSRLGFIIILIWLSSVIGLVTFLVMDLGPDLCNHQSLIAVATATTTTTTAVPFPASGADQSVAGWEWPIPLAITSVQIIFPMLLTSIFHLSSESKIRSCKPLVSYPYDSSLLRANVVIYLLFIVCWTPLMVASGLSASGPNNSAEDVVAAAGDDSSSLSTRSLPLRIFQQLQWLAMAKSCLNPFIYALCSKHYREAFVSLFHYCCCKTSVSFSRRVRADSLRPPSDVRVHIIPGYNVYSAVAQGPHSRAASNGAGIHHGHHRDGASSKPMTRPVTTKMSKGSSGKSKSSKEVYEL